MVGMVANTFFLSLFLKKYRRYLRSSSSSLCSKAGATHLYTHPVQASKIFKASSYTASSDTKCLPGSSLVLCTSASWTRRLKNVVWKDKNIQALHKQKSGRISIWMA